MRIISILMLAFALSSCGYRFMPAGGIVPEGTKTIAIPVFFNSTNEPYVDTEMTRAVVEEFLTDGRLMVANLEGADLVLRGKIMKFDVTASAYSANSYVQTYTMNITVNVTLEDARTQKILLDEKGIAVAFITSYPVTLGDLSATKTAKEAAVKQACRDLASTIRSRVMDGF